MSLVRAVEWDGVPITSDEAPAVNSEKAHSELTQCKECEVRWTSRQASHCPNCHRTFGGVYSFDMHQNDSDPVVCYMPLSVGLELKANGMYGRPNPGLTPLTR